MVGLEIDDRIEIPSDKEVGNLIVRSVAYLLQSKSFFKKEPTQWGA